MADGENAGDALRSVGQTATVASGTSKTDVASFGGELCFRLFPFLRLTWVLPHHYSLPAALSILGLYMLIRMAMRPHALVHFNMRI